jgi:hypothetical protein
MKCKNCIYYKPADTKKGTCWGIEIEGNANPKDIKICQGKYFNRNPSFSASPRYTSGQEGRAYGFPSKSPQALPISSLRQVNLWLLLFL